MWTTAFWKALAERAIKTFAQTFAALLIGSQANVPMIGDIDWWGMTQVSLIAALASALLSVAGQQITKTGPSFVDSEVLAPPASPKGEGI
jgi:hypothetical protein